jgi:WD repeat-containing protein 68
MEERPHPLYAIDTFDDAIVTSTFLENLNNKLYYRNTEFLVQYPITRLQFHPEQPRVFCTTSDYFRIFTITEGIELKHTLSNFRKMGTNQQELFAPLTSFDWNTQDTNLCVTCSVDTTCTIWDMNQLQAKTQLIAHDSDVFDVSFSSGTEVFASVGQDGSVRMFDTRSLQHSTILYETNGKPLARLEWNKRNPNYIATFSHDSNNVIVLDVRVPAVPVFDLKYHHAALSCIKWAPQSSLNLLSGGILD